MGGLLAKLFVAIEADLSEFGKEMSKAANDAVKQTGKIKGTLNKVGAAVGPALSKVKDLAKVTVSELGGILADGMRDALSEGASAFAAKAAEGDIFGGITDGLEAAIAAGSETIIDGLTSELLPKLIEASGAMDVLKGAASSMGAAVKGVIPILGAMGKAMLGLMLSPLGLVIAAIAAVVAAFVYWDDIKKIVADVGRAISEWYTANVKPTVDKVMAVIRPLVDFFRDYFGDQIENVINLVSSLLSGDFSGAWEAAKAIVARAGEAIIAAVTAIAPNAIDSMRRMYIGIKTWVMDKLGAVWNWLKGKLEAVGGWFFDLYDAVVGNSYIPDMVDGIGENIARLQKLMVDPIQKATENSKEAMRGLRNDVLSLLESLFPLQSQLKKVMDDIELLERARSSGEISNNTFFRAKEKLEKQKEDIEDDIFAEEFPNLVVDVPLEIIVPADVQQELEDEFGKIAESFEQETEEPLLQSVERIADGIANMVADVGSAIKGLIDAFENGGFVEKVEAIADTIISIIGGLEGLGVISKQPAPSGRATGGSVAPFSTHIVGENGPEILRTGPGGGHIYNNRETQKMLSTGGGGGGNFGVAIDVDASPYFDARVRKVTKPGHESAIQQGAIAGSSLAERNRVNQIERRIPE